MVDHGARQRFNLGHFRNTAALRARARKLGLTPLGLDFARLFALCLYEPAQPALLRRLELPMISSIDERLIAALRDEGWALVGTDDPKLTPCWNQRIEFVTDGRRGELRDGLSYNDRQHVDLLLTTWERSTLRAAPLAYSNRLAQALREKAQRFPIAPAPPLQLFTDVALERRREIAAEDALRTVLNRAVAALPPENLGRLAIVDALDNGSDLDAAIRRYGDESMRVAFAEYREHEVTTVARATLEGWLRVLRRAVWSFTDATRVGVSSDCVEELESVYWIRERQLERVRRSNARFVVARPHLTLLVPPVRQAACA